MIQIIFVFNSTAWGGKIIVVLFFVFHLYFNIVNDTNQASY